MKRFITPIMSLITMAYTVWYMHYGIPYENSGALSKIGLSHHFEFVVWGVLTMLTLGVGIVICFKRYCKTRAYIPLLIVSSIGMALTLCFDFDYDIKPDYYFHCVGSLLFSVVMGATIFILFLLCYNKSKLFEAFTYITSFILLADLVLLIAYKETGLIEVVPIFAGFIMLSAATLRRDKIAITR